MTGLSSWSIRHPSATLVVFAALTLSGAVGFSKLRINNMPDVDVPSVTVTVTEPGAAASELETQVTKVVEGALSGVDAVEHVASSVSEGTSTTTVTMTLGTNLDRATDDVRNAVTAVQAKLPGAAQTPLVARVDVSGAAILTYAVDAPGRGVESLSRLVDDGISNEILAVPGVAKVERSGGVDRAVTLRVDQARMSALGLTVDKVSAAVAAANVEHPGGRLTIGGREQTVRTTGGSASVSELADLPVPTGAGNAVRLGDLGAVEDAWAEPRQRARLDGREVVSLSVYRAAGSSEVDVTRKVRAVAAGLGRTFPGTSLREVTSSTDFVVEGYHASVEALWVGGLLAVAIVWLFLRDVRATLVAAVALPLSLVPTFAVMAWTNASLNGITLLALSLVVGILVDDAIVEIENVVRHMRQSGHGPYRSAMEAADEIGMAVVATTATIVAVFAPVAFMPGIPGRIFASFALATCASVCFSLLVARMLTPLMAAHLVKATGDAHDEPVWVPAYLWVLRKALAYRTATLAVGACLLAGSLAMATRLQTDFMVAADRGRSVLSVELPPGSTLDQTDAVVTEVSRIAAAHPEVTSTYASEGTPVQAGPGGVGSSGEVRTATVTINLRPRSERGTSQQSLERVLTTEFARVPGARLRFGGDGQSGSKYAVTLAGDDPETLTRAAEAVRDGMGDVRGLTNPTTGTSLTKPEVVVRPDPLRLAEIGATTTTLAASLDVATLGDDDRNLAKFDLPDRQVPVVVSVDDRTRSDLSAVEDLPVAGTNATVPLGAVADVAFGAGPSVISRLDRKRSVTVEASMDGIGLGEATAAVAALPAMRGLPEGVRERKDGDGEHLQELVSGFELAVGSGIVLTYLTLVLLFGGFVQPVTILVALPFSLGGALGLLLLCRFSLSMTALIGILMLMGIAAKNSILLVDYALNATRAGLPVAEALVEAGRKRARPIVMTSLAMCGGMLPIALGYGADAESRAPMAVAVIGGLASSTVLSLVYVPVVFSVMEGFQRRVGASLSRLLVDRAPADGVTR